VYARAQARMLRLGSEYYPLALSIDGRRYTNPPPGLRLRPGMLIDNETSAIWGTQLAQEDQPIFVGPVPDEWQPLVDRQRQAFDLGLAIMKPGNTFGQLIDAINAAGAAVLLHGRGAGDDGPLLTPRASGESIRDLRFEAGNAFVWKPTVSSPNGDLAFTWGGDVVVRQTGAERIFGRPHGMAHASADLSDRPALLRSRQAQGGSVKSP